MNIVILTIILPYPLDSGGAQAQYNMIDRLRRMHNITLVFPINEMNSVVALNQLRDLWPDVDFRPYSYAKQLANPKFFYSKAERFIKKTFMKNSERFQVERMLKPYGYSMDGRFVSFMNNIIAEKNADVVQVEFYPYLSFVHKLPKNVRKIFIHHEIRYIRNKRLLANIRLLKKEANFMEELRRKEIDDLNAYDAVVTLTDVDKNELTAAGVTTPILVSPASINAELMKYSGWNGNITFLGGYSHTPNQEGMEWFVDKVLPLVDWSKYPNAKIQIVGGGWPASYNNIEKPVTVQCRGFVKELAPVAHGSIMIIPILSGSGMRMKILEAAAMGLPMVTTTVGVEGLLFQNEVECMVADAPQDFAAALEKLMANEELRAELTNNARELYEQKYSVEATSNVRNSVYMNSSKK